MIITRLKKIDRVRVVIEVEAPFFQEGSSTLHVRLTEPLSFSLEDNNLHDGAETLPADIIEGDILSSIKKFKITDNKDDFKKPGNYYFNKIEKFLIVRDFHKTTLAANNFRLDSIKIMAWTRLSVGKKIDHNSKETIWFPWRTPKAFTHRSASTEENPDEANMGILANDANTWSHNTRGIELLVK